jgi:hypothetical protein
LERLDVFWLGDDIVADGFVKHGYYQWHWYGTSAVVVVSHAKDVGFRMSTQAPCMELCGLVRMFWGLAETWRSSSMGVTMSSS